jgi:hypothetical protein
VFLTVIYQFPVKEKLPVDFTEPTNKFIALEMLSVCVGRNPASNGVLKCGELREEHLALRFQLSYGTMIWLWIALKKLPGWWGRWGRFRHVAATTAKSWKPIG